MVERGFITLGIYPTTLLLKHLTKKLHHPMTKVAIFSHIRTISENVSH